MPKLTSSAITNADELLKDEESSNRGLSFERIGLENRHIHNKTLRQCRFDGLTFKEAQIRDCAFLHTRFTDCYFKNAVITRVKFVDCFFAHCDFDGAVFSNCSFEYSEFRDSRITYTQIEGSLAQSWQNVLLRLARSLRINAQSVGDYEEYRRFLSVELEASETHYKYVFTRYDGYYKKYRVIDRLRAVRKWLSLKIDRTLWGHGEDWTRVVIVATAVVFIFALIFRYCTVLKNMPDGATFWNYLGFSACSFLTLGYENAGPATGVARLLQIVEASMGYLFFGLLVTSLYVRISKR